MKRLLIVIILAAATLYSSAQPVFRTVVPQQSIVAGESFQVQYVLEDIDQVNSFAEPDFRGFRRVTGPYIYSESKTINAGKKIRNTVYTLTAINPGRFVIRGATITINGRSYTSNDAIVEVISREEAAKRLRKNIDEGNPDYFLRPGEDPYEKIRNNLFVKVQVNKRNCYVGEPVVATFKLYSRLESRSDIVKNPGFYGFTVYDMVSLGDRKSSIEVINGKAFDVHTIRQVQLFPLREGRFVVDGMDIKNSVEFSRSRVNKKTEQEIMEGVLQNTEDNIPAEGTELYETTNSTEEIAITVNASPLRNKPSTFTGATGDFTLSGYVLEDKLAKNEQGVLEICIKGNGNFTQLDAPVINWPAGVEGFEPTIKDSIDKSMTPLGGSRVYRYAFVSVDPGNHIIPAVNLSYFNPRNHSYNTLSTKPINIYTSNEEPVIAPSNDQSTTSTGSKPGWIYFAGGAVILLGVFAVFILVRKKKKIPVDVQAVQTGPAISPVHELLSAPGLLAHADEKEFYASLRQAIWKFFSQHLILSGSEMNKRGLSARLSELKTEGALVEKILSILEQCETGMYTKAELSSDKTALLETTKETLAAIQAQLF